jgi:hypothetical protein
LGHDQGGHEYVGDWDKTMFAEAGKGG